MKPLYIKIGDLSLVIIPDTQAHLDGHEIITHTYSIFADVDGGDPSIMYSRESHLHLQRINDPNYYGYIAFELPDKLFVYSADGQLELETEEVEKVIEFLSSYRSNPNLWQNRN